MQQDEPASSYATQGDLESPPVVEEPPDLVASLVHVSRERKLQLTPTTTSLHTERAPTQPLQVLKHHQYVVSKIDKQHNPQVSQITAPPNTKASITSSISSPHDSPTFDNARLTEPFSPVLRVYTSDSGERSPTPVNHCKISGE
jgi:hypothetical protein